MTTTPASVGAATPPAIITKVDHLLRESLIRKNPALFDPNEPNEQQPAIQLMELSVPVGDSMGFRATGRYYHAVQINGIAGSDSIKIEGSLDGTHWFACASGVSALVANGITQFTGLFAFIRATRNTGTGVATEVLLFSCAAA